MVRVIGDRAKGVLKGVARRVARRDVVLPLARNYRVIFVFHDLSDPSARHHSPIYSTPPSIFERQVAWLARRFELVSLDEIIDPERRPDGRPLAALTFDDGFRSVREVGHPILRDRGIPYTVFLIRNVVEQGRMWVAGLILNLDRVDLQTIRARYCDGSVDEASFRADPIGALVDHPKDADRLHEVLRHGVLDGLDVEDGVFLGRSDIEALAAEGVDFGNHSANHPNLGLCSDSVVSREISEGHAGLSEWLGRRPRYFAPPYGKARHFDQRSIAKCRELGYRALLSNEPRFFGVSALRAQEGMMVLPRVALTDQIGRDLIYLLNLSFLRTFRRTP